MNEFHLFYGSRGRVGLSTPNVFVLLILLCYFWSAVRSYQENCTSADAQFFYHLHIPKAGGTSMKRYLTQWNKERRFGCLASIEGSYEDGKRLFPNKEVRIFSMFRNPIDHVLSQYQHCKTSYSHKYGWHLMPSLSTWLNAHVEYNGGIPHNITQYQCYDPFNLQYAKLQGHTPKELWYVGVLDHIQVGHCLLYYKIYGEVLSSCNCNALQSMYIRHDQHGVQKFDRSQVTEEDRAYIYNLTRIDQLLYEAAMSEFQNRVRNFERKTGVQLLGCS